MSDPIPLARLRELAAELLALRNPNTNPPTREEVAAHEAHGGFWFVTQVENAMPGAPSDLRPMVLRVLTRDDRLIATIPGNDYGSFWDEPDPFSLMPGAAWTPLDRDGAVLARAKESP